MTKEIPGKELKAAAKDLNKILKASGAEQIKIAGAGLRKEDVPKDFKTKIEEFIDAERTGELTDPVIDFYNKYIVVEEETEDGVPENDEDGKDASVEEKPKAKTARKKATSGTGKKTSTTKEKKPARGMGLMEYTVDLYMKGTTDIKKLCTAVQKKFPDSNPKKSITHVCNIMKHVMTRIPE